MEGVLTSSYEEVKENLLKTIDERREEVVGFLQELVRIPSPEGGGHKIQERVADYLRKMGADKVDIFKPDIKKLKKHLGFSPVFHEHGGTPVEEKPVVVATFKGTGRGRSLFFVGHMESATGPWEPVTVERWKHDPFAAEIEGDALYGKGVLNMKSGNAAGIMALKAVREAGIKLKGDVFISTNIDEDIGSQGTLEVTRRGYRADAGLCPEPTGLNLVIANEGCQHFRVIVKGRATYTSGEYLCPNAIEKAFKVYWALKDLEAFRRATHKHPLFDHSGFIPITIGMIRGGTWPCNTAEECILEGTMHHLPDENLTDVKRQLEEQVKLCAQQDPFMKRYPPEVEWWEYWSDEEIDVNHPIVQITEEAYREVMGEGPRIAGFSAAGDADKLTRYANTPTIFLGPKSARYVERGRMPFEDPVDYDESVSVESYIQLTKIFALTILKWCGYE